MNVEVHIERLVLEGVARGEGARIRRAMERELVSFLKRSGGLPSGFAAKTPGAVVARRAITCDVARAMIGRRAAEAVLGAISEGPRTIVEAGTPRAAQ